jgi:methionyl-tRNA formyltransferase
MRIVFMGTPAFAVPSLQALVAHHDVELVVTRRDGASGRGGALKPSAVKVAAIDAGVDLLQPAVLDASALSAITAARPDVICVAAFGMLLPVDVLAVPPMGCLNVHASLLPRYRGAAPIQRAVLNNEAVTGVSIMQMERGLDTGPYALQREVELGERYAVELEAELAEVGASALLEVLEQVERGTAVWTPQDETAATYAAKIIKDDVALLPTLSVREAFARVRSATRRAPARACLGDCELTVVRARPASPGTRPGAVCLVDGEPVLGFGDGGLALEVVRPAGRGDMLAADWARGARLAEGTCWRCTR